MIEPVQGLTTATTEFCTASEGVGDSITVGSGSSWAAGEFEPPKNLHAGHGLLEGEELFVSPVC